MTRFRHLAMASGLGLLLASGAMAQGGGGGGAAGGASGSAAGAAGAAAGTGGVNGGANPGSIGMGQPSTPPRGGGSAASGAGAATGQGGAAGQPGSQGQTGTQPSGGTQTRRGALEQQQRTAGVANPAERDAQQLRDLNAMSKRLAPNAPVPAPEAGTSPPAR